MVGAPLAAVDVAAPPSSVVVEQPTSNATAPAVVAHRARVHRIGVIVPGAYRWPMAFSGFTDETFAFYDELVADNSRTFWQANKHRYAASVRAPLDALLEQLADFGPFHVFRPYKDVRFSKDKVPYKDHQGAYSESQGGAGFYVQVSVNGLLAGTGYYSMASDQLERFRAAVDADAVGAEIAGIVSRLERKGYTAGSIGELKTAPRGYPKDHPRITLLRRKGLMVSRSWAPADWMSGRSLVTKVRDAWRGAVEMNEWLDLHVGPSTLAPSDDELARFGPF